MKIELEFTPSSEAKKLDDDTRCLVIDDKGTYNIGVWDSRGWWYDEASIIYDSGMEKIENVIGFIVNKYK